jgi:hypothetical protein
MRAVEKVRRVPTADNLHAALEAAHVDFTNSKRPGVKMRSTQ